MIVRELNGGKCKTYAVCCSESARICLIDPVADHVDRYLSWLAYMGYRLESVIDTHTHADHLSGGMLLSDLVGVPVIQHEEAPNPRVNQHVVAGDLIPVGNLSMKVLHTPGHTPDSISLVADNCVFTGDVLLIGGTGRADFAGGDAGTQYDSITTQLFPLPDETIVYPGHDYRGNTQSTIGQEKTGNPRIAGKTKQEYVDLMNSIEFPLPSRIQEVLQPNQSAVDDDVVHFPTLAQLNEVRQLEPDQVRALMDGGDAPVLLDVREEEEYHGELGHIGNSILLPLKGLSGGIDALGLDHDFHIVVICRSGVRSTTGAAILTGLGFTNVSNLKGGMLEWNRQRAGD